MRLNVNLPHRQLDFLTRFERTDPLESIPDQKHNRRFILNLIVYVFGVAFDQLAFGLGANPNPKPRLETPS